MTAYGALTQGILRSDSMGLTRRASAAENTNESAPGFQIGVFTKPFNSLTYDELASQVADLGLQGIEGTIRRGGNVEPERVEQDLPRLVDSLSRHDLKLLVMTTDINRADDPSTQRVLATASKLGVQRFRMSYVKYDFRKPIVAQLDRWRRQFESLATLCRQYGITAMYQNHAGERNMGASLWDLDRVLADIDPAEIGVAFDIRHATIEAGTSWPVAWRLLQHRVKAIYVKDFDWRGDNVANVPLGQGRVPRRFFDEFLPRDFSGPISLHEEYLDHRDPTLVPRHWDAIASDLSTLRGWLHSAE
ncbi:MAG: sugar phosphate isomerase/epimerase family protein [Planctomycetota bacterium]